MTEEKVTGNHGTADHVSKSKHDQGWNKQADKDSQKDKIHTHLNTHPKKKKKITCE